MSLPIPKIDSLAQLSTAAVKNEHKHLILSMLDKFVDYVKVISIFNFILKLVL